MWTAFVLVALGAPALIPALVELVPRRAGIAKRTYLRAVGRSFALAVAQIALNVAFLAHQAWLMSDAIARTLVRLYVTRRRQLEWLTAAQSTSESALAVIGVYRRMAGALVLALAAAALVALIRPGAWAIAGPFVVLWALSPLVARWVSQPPRVSESPALSPQDATMLRTTARRTWRFFEAFVGPDDSFLPPDNFQEDPKPVLAHRTSPTNIGLSLLATVAARDFGWIGALDTVDRLEATLATMRRLERFRGHFYNWYDTVDLRPLEPRYVSTVDSGNLAGHLLVLGAACRSAVDHPLLDGRAFTGIEDTLRLVQEAVRDLAHGPAQSDGHPDRPPRCRGCPGRDAPRAPGEPGRPRRRSPSPRRPGRHARGHREHPDGRARPARGRRRRGLGPSRARHHREPRA